MSLPVHVLLESLDVDDTLRDAGDSGRGRRNRAIYEGLSRGQHRFFRSNRDHQEGLDSQLLLGNQAPRAEALLATAERYAFRSNGCGSDGGDGLGGLYERDLCT